MGDEQERRELAEMFELLGADDPQSWAVGEIEEGIPYLAMYVFLRRASAVLGKDGVDGWVRTVLHRHAPEHTESKDSLSRILANNASRDDIRHVLSALHRDLLMEFCCLLDSCASTHFADPELSRRTAEVRWKLFSTDELGNAQSPMDGLHEIVNDVLD